MIEYAIKEAMQTIEKNLGGPFGALITNKDGSVISIASNTVLGNNDPTAHAEINAIRLACKKLGTYDLTGCTIHTTSYPCPMCIGAIICSNIKIVYYGCSYQDAKKAGFRDDLIYKFIKSGCKDEKILKINQIDRDKCIKLFEKYKDENKQIY